MMSVGVRAELVRDRVAARHCPHRDPDTLRERVRLTRSGPRTDGALGIQDRSHQDSRVAVIPSATDRGAFLGGRAGPVVAYLGWAGVRRRGQHPRYGSAAPRAITLAANRNAPILISGAYLAATASAPMVARFRSSPG
jgi:hypothetical protein